MLVWLALACAERYTVDDCACPTGQICLQDATGREPSVCVPPPVGCADTADTGCGAFNGDACGQALCGTTELERTCGPHDGAFVRYADCRP